MKIFLKSSGRWMIAVGILAIAIMLADASVKLGGNSAYDLQGIGVGFYRPTILMLWVLFARRIISFIEDDDLESDWDRINNGNVSVGIYRGLEFFGLVIAGALLLSKI